MPILRELDAMYRESLTRSSTLHFALFFHFLIHVLDLVGTKCMVEKNGLGYEGNELAKFLMQQEFVHFETWKLFVVPAMAILGTSLCYHTFKRRKEIKGDCTGWAEYVIVLMQALNTVYTVAFAFIAMVSK